MASDERTIRTNEGATPGKGRLVLCFDGTGNKYRGDSGDTNIVKLYNLFDRDDPSQWHYYQPGIGTYTSDAEKINISYWGSFKRWLSQVLDQGFGSSFDEHVIAGYKFLMRYYDTGDQVYVFGFSRGAFTARFLARMIAHVGVLSKGNEEMIPFAYRAYQQYEQGVGGLDKLAEHEAYLKNFSETFCRPVKVHFLGLFDTVASVKTFDPPLTKKTTIPALNTYASHVRHAVALDERRAKFKPALVGMDKRKQIVDTDKQAEDTKELWFPGNHGDIGGGWLAPKTEGDKDLQLSTLPLEWMVKELQGLKEEDGVEPIKFNSKVNAFLEEVADAKNRQQAVTSLMHDVLKPGPGGTRWYMRCLWQLIEHLPFGYMQLTKTTPQAWENNWGMNMGAGRAVPSSANFSSAVAQRINAFSSTKHKYQPAGLDQDRVTKLLNAAAATTNGVNGH